MRIYMEGANAALHLGTTTDTVTRWAKEGRLPVAAKTVRGVRLYNHAAVERLRQQRARERKG